VLTPGGEAMVGDLLMGGWFGGRVRTTRPVRHYFAESPERVPRSLALLDRLGVTRLYPAIGGALAIDDVRAYVPFEARSESVGISPIRLRERRLAIAGAGAALRAG
ncbi:MAG: hypothetical protein MUF21_10480, partial [Gemmatimonadaceae bacterium]|nr:hypothetical protein [Gemmatimonadaceae bacterium]